MLSRMEGCPLDRAGLRSTMGRIKGSTACKKHEPNRRCLKWTRVGRLAGRWLVVGESGDESVLSCGEVPRVAESQHSVHQIARRRAARVCNAALRVRPKPAGRRAKRRQDSGRKPPPQRPGITVERSHTLPFAKSASPDAKRRFRTGRYVR